MCYSAMVEQDVKRLSRRFGAEVDWDSFKRLFGARLEDSSLKVARSLEANFDAARSPGDSAIRTIIENFRSQQGSAWEAELFKQKKRLVEAQPALEVKETRRAREDERIATEKIERYRERLGHLHRRESKSTDARIYPLYHVPVIVQEGGRRWVRPMRYHCRLPGKPAVFDRKYPGLYNARRDSLEKFWKPLFGHQHAVMVVSSFYENVPLHRYERRDLRPGEKESNVVLHFDPRPPTDMLVACIWARWEQPGECALESFAAITDDPPPEVSAAGHDRCIIPITDENVDEWLSPEGVSPQRLGAILSDRQTLRYELSVAA